MEWTYTPNTTVLGTVWTDKDGDGGPERNSRRPTANVKQTELNIVRTWTNSITIQHRCRYVLPHPTRHYTFHYVFTAFLTVLTSL